MSPSDVPAAPIDLDKNALEERRELLRYVDDVALKIGRAFIENPREGGWAVFREHREELSKAMAIIESIRNDMSAQITKSMLCAIVDQPSDEMLRFGNRMMDRMGMLG